MPAFINAISYHLPERIVTNEEFYTRFPAGKGSGLDKIGVSERHIVGENETASDLAVQAAEKLFAEQGIDRSTIDFVLFCAQEFDYYTPTTACVIQQRLGLPRNCGALDYNLGCSGFAYGLGVAKGLIEGMGAKNVLLLTASTLTKTFHPGDRSSHFIFGDGAAATLITRSDDARDIGPFVYGSDGQRFEKIIVRDGGARNALSETSHDAITDEFGNTTSRDTFYMDGTGVLLFTLKTVPAMVNETLAKAGLGVNEIDLFVFHQANCYMNEMLRKKLGIPEEKFVHCMDHFGNTVSSTIPIALYESRKNGRLKPGMRVLVAGFGTGLSWACTIVRF